MRRSILAALAGLSVLSLDVSGSMSAEYLTAEQLNKHFSGSKASFLDRRGNHLTVWYNSNGTLVGQGEYVSFEGKWWVDKPNKYCFSTARTERECRRLMHTGGNKYTST